MGSVSETASLSLVTYFGYGSNLWLEQMAMRCPHSSYLGVARLNGYRWMINDRGYANVVKLAADEAAETSDRTDNGSVPVTGVVYGLVYNLTAADERNLDINEGVPFAYTKHFLPVDFWQATGGDKRVDVTKRPTPRNMLVYVDLERTTDDVPKKEYIYRMNKGIDDALKVGVPQEYVEKVIRRFIPAVHEEEVEKQARKQALVFEDER